jgi:hypothetical protein
MSELKQELLQWLDEQIKKDSDAKKGRTALNVLDYHDDRIEAFLATELFLSNKQVKKEIVFTYSNGSQVLVSGWNSYYYQLWVMPTQTSRHRKHPQSTWEKEPHWTFTYYDNSHPWYHVDIYLEDLQSVCVDSKIIWQAEARPE